MTVRQLLVRAALVAIIAAVGAVAAYALTASKAKQYSATAELLFAPRANPLTGLGVGAGPLEQGAAAANDVLDMGSFDVARATAHAMADPRFDADTIADDVQVASGGGDVVGVVAKAESPQDAARLANTYMHEYIGMRRRRTIGQARNARSALTDALNKLPIEFKNTVRGDSLREQIGDLDVLLRTGDAPTVIQRARAKSGAIGPPTARNTLFGLLFGAVLGIGLVAARTAMRPAPREY